MTDFQIKPASASDATGSVLTDGDLLKLALTARAQRRIAPCLTAPDGERP